MTNRRQFLQMGASALGLLTIPGAAFSNTKNNNTKMPFDKIVYDKRILDCEKFAKQAERLGADTYAIEGDVSDLWYDDLRDRLSETPGVIAGLTTESSAYLLQVLGHDVFHHQVFRGDHFFKDDKIIRHRFTAPEYLLHTVAEIDHGNQYWSIDMAELLARYDVQKSRSTKATIEVSVRPDEATHNLVSWIIAPIYNDNKRRV